MHGMALVIGGDPQGQVARHCSALAAPGVHCDWFAVGGRYTGHLVLKLGATSGRVFGDAVPDFEAATASWFAEHAPAGLVLARGDGRSRRGPGVDQARKTDIDWPATVEAATIMPAVVIAGGVWHQPGEATAVLDAYRLTRGVLGTEHADHAVKAAGLETALQLAYDADHDWWHEIDRLIYEAADDALFTVVDIHR